MAQRRNRTITVHLAADDEQDYADAANAIWAVMAASRFDFNVQPDKRSDPTVLNEWWEKTGVRWH